MEIIDVSLAIAEDMPTYRGRREKQPKIERIRTLEEGANEIRLTLESHTGTHIDAPLHMLPSEISIDRIPLAKFMGPALVLEILNSPAIDENNLMPFENLLFPGHFVLLKTDNSFTDLSRDDFVYLTERGAMFLARKNLKGVGIDALGIERNQPGHPTHRILLEQGLVIVEGLFLRDVPPGFYFFIALPLKVQSGDGAPARALLVRM
ncbi:MAG: cyclase family protein [Candidatus Caldatribacterium sp.]|uniref:cyclase family protein n=1 Tax=Candidatus Caldatribacterium sp. TaxID=2282143 RepID=UPI002994093F|nr:cyclase family protein [Candidatus Caldatribacterium sp.]MCX7731061.1 cyclase family protein [Candidatus Caldatribacterium sp.]MDW8081234.1 cyclase family protein [Candidatus Calescibacterium sp.]